MREPILASCNPAEQAALRSLYERDLDAQGAFTDWMHKVHRDGIQGCLIVRSWCGMTVGIEQDGYTHT
jgi:hypothetical protein